MSAKVAFLRQKKHGHYNRLVVSEYRPGTRHGTKTIIENHRHKAETHAKWKRIGTRRDRRARNKREAG